MRVFHLSRCIPSAIDGHRRTSAKAPAGGCSSQLTCRGRAPKTRHQFEPASAENAAFRERFDARCVCLRCRAYPDRPFRRFARQGARRRSGRGPDQGADGAQSEARLVARSTRSISAAPTRPARTTATWRAWRCCWPACRNRFPASRSTASAPPVSMRSAPPARAIRAGEIDFAIAGGVESMTRAPFVMGKAPEAFSRSAEIYDTTIGWRFINPLMKAQYGVDSMPETGENVAEEFQVSRADQDAFAIRSQQRAGKAHRVGLFRRGDHRRSTVPGGKAGPIIVDKDEHPRPDTTLEGARQAEADRAQSRHGDGRQCVRRQRRRGRDDPRLRSRGEEARPDAARAHSRPGLGRRCRRASWASARCRRRAS